VDAGLVDSMENHDSNITGVLDLDPNAIDKTVEFIDDNFADANIGLIYNSGEANSVTQIENVNKAVKGTSLSTSERKVANSSEVQQVASKLSGDTDVTYIVLNITVG